MASRHALPYYAPDLPGALPTEEEIESGSDLREYCFKGRRVVAVREHYIVKYGLDVNLLKGDNMIFVRETTNIRAPRVYALYYIVMERIRGESLQSQWPLLQGTDKQCIIKDLQSYFMDLRKLTPPNPSYYGSLDRRPLQDMVFWTAEPNAKFNGPFDGHEEFIEAMIEKYTRDGGPGFRAECYRQCLPQILCRCNSVFTHGDFQRKNVMVEKDQERSGWKVTLLDWEFLDGIRATGSTVGLLAPLANWTMTGAYTYVVYWNRRIMRRHGSSQFVSRCLSDIPMATVRETRDMDISCVSRSTCCHEGFIISDIAH
ncbi:hypothetical protein D0865_02330 [Hortaea werneckii]|uniref:Aminoglycoside phosphotransferase domain-containing protein n=1 Tax=Hortaea werneckii TaxID=91943 RepID=A0A3M7D3W6_HORWE|nr:hypothetical protein D0865_02330 [Hortaea werneckii]